MSGTHVCMISGCNNPPAPGLNVCGKCDDAQQSELAKMFPRGKVTPGDEGKLAMAFVVKGNTLIVDFGKPVAWIGFSLHEVTQLRKAFERYEAELTAVSS